MKNITLKDSLALLSITKKAKEDFIEHILTQSIKAGVILDEPEYCGDTLFSFFDENGYNETAATLFCIGKSTNELIRLFKGLVIWGKADECPECGCALNWSDGQYITDMRTGEQEIMWEELSCDNPHCDYKETTDNEPDPDRNID